MAALAGFWGRPADHREVAEEICYDGTPDHRQRSWAERNGYVAREFTVTWESACALLDRGIPFTLTTVETQSAHLQAVIGYDARRGTLLFRDPTLPYSAETMGKEMLERYRSTGPRGSAMIPADRVGLLDGLDLPDAPLYDHLHRMQVALREHDRERAGAAYEALAADCARPTPGPACPLRAGELRRRLGRAAGRRRGATVAFPRRREPPAQPVGLPSGPGAARRAAGPVPRALRPTPRRPARAPSVRAGADGRRARAPHGGRARPALAAVQARRPARPGDARRGRARFRADA